jgi:hypothetical protein
VGRDAVCNSQIETFLENSGAAFVLEYLEEAVSENADRERYMGRVIYRLQKRPDLSEDIREHILAIATEFSERLLVRVIVSDDLSSAQKLCGSIARELGSEPFRSGLFAVTSTWPATIAHELQRLLVDLECASDHGPMRRGSSPEAVLFQVRDTVETVLKFPTLVLASLLIKRGSPEDHSFAWRRLLRRIHGGEWLALARELAARVRNDQALSSWHTLADMFSANGSLYRAIDLFIAVRNDEAIGHGAHRLDPRETAKLLQVVLTGDRNAARELGVRIGPSIAQGIAEAARLDPWKGKRLIAVCEDEIIDLTGAQSLTSWLSSGTHAPDHHCDRDCEVALLLEDDTTLELGPFVRARICEKCSHQDIFLYDTLYDHRADGIFDLIDYGRGHKMRRKGSEAQDLRRALAGRIEAKEFGQIPAGALSSRDIVETLDAARVDRRYLSPKYLRQSITEFVSSRSQGVMWLQAPAHVGKTTLVQGLTDPLLDEPLFPVSEQSHVAVACFFCKSEYRSEGRRFLHGLERAIEHALDIRPDPMGERPSLQAASKANIPSQGLIEQIDAWRDFAVREHHATTRPRLLIVIDGLDETAGPEDPDSLAFYLPQNHELSSGIYFLLTSRLATDGDSPRWLEAVLGPLVASNAVQTYEITLKHPGYIGLLKKYVRQQLGSNADDALFKNIVERAEYRFLYVAFLTERIRRFNLPVDQLRDLPAGSQLYVEFLDSLQEVFHPKFADAIEEVLLILSAEELAHRWIASPGAPTDRATGLPFEFLSDDWPGMPLTELAGLTGFDLHAADGSIGFDPRFIEILFAVQGVLFVSRGNSDVPLYTLGLKGLSDQVVQHPQLGPKLLKVHEKLGRRSVDATSKLIELDEFKVDPEAEPPPSELIEQGREAADVLFKSDVNALGHIHLSRQPELLQRWRALNVADFLSYSQASLNKSGFYLISIFYRNLAAFWLEDQLSAADDAQLTKAPIERVQKLCAIYQDRGATKRLAPGYGFRAAIADYDVAIRILEPLQASSPDRRSVNLVFQLAAAYNNKANAIKAARGHDPSSAIDAYDKAASLLRDFKVPETADRLEWASMQDQLGSIYVSRGSVKLDAVEFYAVRNFEHEGLSDLDAAIQIRENIRDRLGAEWPDELRKSLSNAYAARADALTNRDLSKALTDFEAAIEIGVEIYRRLGEGNFNISWMQDFAQLLAQRGQARFKSWGRHPDIESLSSAINDYFEAIEFMQAIGARLRQQWPEEWRFSLASTYFYLGRAQLEQSPEMIPFAINGLSASIARIEALGQEMAERWPPYWQVFLASVYLKRGQTRHAISPPDWEGAWNDYSRGIAILEFIATDLQARIPLQWRSDLLNLYLARSRASVMIAERGVPGAVMDLEAAANFSERVTSDMDWFWGMQWCADLAQVGLGFGSGKKNKGDFLGAIADFSAVISLFERITTYWQERRPSTSAYYLASAYGLRGTAKLLAIFNKMNESPEPQFDPVADYDRAIEIMTRLGEQLGDQWPSDWRNELADIHMGRANAKMAVGFTEGDLDHYQRAIDIRQGLRKDLGAECSWKMLDGLARSFVTRGVARTSFVNPDHVAAMRDFDAAIEVLTEAMNKVFEDPDDSQKLLDNLQLAREFRERSFTASSNETD